MEIGPDTEPPTITTRLRQVLLELARREDVIAATECAGVPYWSPVPASVIGHRAAAAALRSHADRFLEAC